MILLNAWGFAHKLCTDCDTRSCNFVMPFFTSNECVKATHINDCQENKDSVETRGRKKFEINVHAVEIFRRSIDTCGFVFSEYLGNGDTCTSSFKEVVSSKPYGSYGVTPNKLECVGHVQERLGTRLKNKRKEYKRTKTPLSGRGRLTDKLLIHCKTSMVLQSDKTRVIYIK